MVVPPSDFNPPSLAFRPSTSRVPETKAVSLKSMILAAKASSDFLDYYFLLMNIRMAITQYDKGASVSNSSAAYSDASRGAVLEHGSTEMSGLGVVDFNSRGAARVINDESSVFDSIRNVADSSENFKSTMEDAAKIVADQLNLHISAVNAASAA